MTRSQTPDYDAIVCGAGFGGMYLLHRLRDILGKNVLVVDRASDVGGTWYWNRYPGCRCDIPSIHYAYSFSEQIQQEWTWSEKYAAQPEILEYANFVANKLDLRRSMAFETHVRQAVWDDDAAVWTVTLEDANGQREVTCRFYIAATGILSAGNIPAFKGAEVFKGETYFSGRWPHEKVDFSGKRVAVIGTGATAIQIIPEVAKEAEHLTVFQRTANYAVPLGNRPMSAEESEHVKRNYREIRRRAWAWDCLDAIPGKHPKLHALDDTPEEREARFEWAWGEGGFELWLGTYVDILFDEKANKTVADFVRKKIRERVNDPDVAEILCPPEDMLYGTRRQPCETNYYQTYNRDNVTLVDIRANPISEITESGIVVGNEHYTVDAIIYATGFDAFTGPIFSQNLVGRGGKTIQEHWADGAHSLMGYNTHDFPNFLMITGVMSPSALFNIPLGIERDSEWLTDLIQYMDAHGYIAIEADEEAEEAWVEHVAEVADETLLTTGQSWYLGSNIPGKPRRFVIYLGGGPKFKRIVDDCAAEGYKGFTFRSEEALASKVA
jgi:cation diffusion facilitator CzcD-associated flavoprotein CzcO